MPNAPDRNIRRRIRVHGIVQGVGFRPWIYRLATGRNLAGYVLNDTEGVLIEVEGPSDAVESLLACLRRPPPAAANHHGAAPRPQWPCAGVPPLARITAVAVTDVPPQGDTEFVIRHSDRAAAASTAVSPDMAICHDCLREMFDPADRRYRYPFINCTHCGPRYSIILDVPYDRPRTTMRSFAMCPACRREYEDPADRRFHAQPNACPVCGPQLSLHDSERRPITTDDPVEFVRQKLLAGAIVLIKGLTGYHLACDARSETAVAELRRRKRRDEKPLALMVADIDAAAQLALLDEFARRLLGAPERSVVLAPRRPDAAVAPSIAPRSLYLGLMLPYAPLHFLLFAGGLPPLVMTSANVSEEPMCKGNDEVFRRMRGFADFFLLHNRDIQTICDDSVTMIQRGEPLVVRRARGYAPRPIHLAGPARRTILAVGGELKNALCLTRGHEAYVSQHIGDLKNPLALAYFQETDEKLRRLLEVAPQVVAHDLHPLYFSTRYAKNLPGVERTEVQHHHAHIASVMAEHGLAQPVIGLAMDGTGFGLDRAAWGSEFLYVRPDGTFDRLGHLSYVNLPGGDAAIEKVVRIAYAYLVQACGAEADAVAAQLLPQLAADERLVLRQMIEKGIHAPPACGLGRLFDAASALTGVAARSTYEGQAAIELETVIEPGVSTRFDFDLVELPAPAGGAGGRFEISPLPLIRGLVAAMNGGAGPGRVAARFHNTVVAMLLSGAGLCRKITGLNHVALAGGCFLNRYLVEHLVPALEAEGFTVFRHREVSPGDGGLALGQVEVARQRIAAGTL